MKILVLGGGTSNEREVSLRSAKAVAIAARRAGFDVMEADHHDEPLILDKIGSDTIVFPILHGAYGEDGGIQTELEKRQLPFLGSASAASAKCWDKWQSLNTIRAAGVPIARSQLVDRENFKDSPLVKNPYVLKVRRGGSSIGVLVARNAQSIKNDEIAAIFNMEEPAILEEFVPGIEITVAILDDQPLPVVEIHPPQGKEFDYENKYNGQSQELSPPPNVSKEGQKKAQDLAIAAHKALGCRHLSRTDMIVKDDGGVFVFDVNTMPGLTDQSLYPKAAAVADMTMPQLVTKFAELVERDYNL